ncbi:TIR domain-containing protein [Mycobacterium sp.]|uniref:nSTAND1 domain-containing NTPase n=1 Tax=Mycobacterium sp. TaxID=1785 RepID=UPI002BC432D9|nr:TIR domain-containing protein [Mycobacterium sp.]HTH86991.1 TIR domain-containing protein [Mycobacterium sp.]
MFLSHSSLDSREATAVKAWLIEHEPGLAEEIFLDLDPHTGIRPGERWRQALQRANSRCEAVICLLSKHWEASRECQAEFRYAETLNKTILCARLEPLADTGITSEWQRCDLFTGDGLVADITVDNGEPVRLASDGMQRLLEALRALGIGAEHFPWPPPGDPGRAPYRGWAPLTEADAAVFFGRDAQILRGLDVLHGMRTSGVESLLVILGPSGAGKSSFLRAGLLPRLHRDDRRFLPLPIVRPERAALTGEHGMAQAVHSLRTDLGLREPMLGEIKNACLTPHVEQLRGWLEEARQVARTRLFDVAAEQPAPTLVLPVDQAEELFNADAGPQAPQFLELVAALVQHEAGVTPAMIVAMTIRADRYEPLQIAPELAGVHSAVFDELKPMPPAGHSEVITGPARRATAAGHRLVVEPALVERLLTEAAEGADALPLLALTLERLYRDFGDDGDLTVAEYESMGGMAQVVQTEVDKLLDNDKRHAQLDMLHDAFIPWLATINPGNDQPMRRLARWDDLPVASRPLIQAMVEKRLLVKDTRDGQTVVEVALESLLRQWRELAAWLRDEAQSLKDADSIERAAADWRASGRNESWLLEGSRLVHAEALAVKPGFRSRLDPTRDFLQASRTRENDRVEAEQRRRTAELEAAQRHAAAMRKRSKVLIAVLAVTAIVAVMAVILGMQANTARNQSDARFREATSLRLVSEAQSMLAGNRPGGDVRAFEQLLVGQQLARTPDEGPLLTALVKRVNTLKIVEAASRVFALAVSPDGHRIVSAGDDKTVRLWDADTGQPVGQPLTGHTDTVSEVAFSPDGHRIVSGSRDKTLRLWDAGTGKPIGQPLTGHSNAVYSVAFSPDGHRIASGSADTTVRLWDPDTGKPIGEPLTGHTDTVYSVAFSPDGRRIASGSADTTVSLWDAETGNPVGEPLTGHQDVVNGVVFSPDGTRIISGSSDRTVRVWGVDVGRPITGHADGVWSVAFSPDGRLVVSGSVDKTLRVWDADTGHPVGPPLIGHMEAVDSVAVSPDGHRIASGSADKTVRLWDADTGKPIGQPLTGHTDTVYSVAFSPDGHRIVSGSRDKTLRVWDADTGHPVGPPLTGHTAWVSSVAVSPDGRRIASGSADKTVRLWDADTGKPIGQPLTGHTDTVLSVAFSPDGTRVVSGSIDKTLRVWDAATGHLVGQPLAGHSNAVYSVAFSPDGRHIASGSSDTTVRLWDADTGEPIGDPLTGHTDAVESVAFDPDGKRIVSGAADKTLRLWPAYADTKMLCGKLTTNMTHSQWQDWVSPDIDYIRVCPDLPVAPDAQAG